MSRVTTLYALLLSSLQTDFFAIMTQIQKDCASSEAPASNTSVGSPILAKFGFDNQWYRSQVTGRFIQRSHFENIL